MTDLLYKFEESGVGCAKHADPACLCDVKPLPDGVPIVKVPDPHRYPPNGGNQALRFIVWASTALGRFEALIGVNETDLNIALGIWEGREAETRYHAAAQRQHAVALCLAAGLTIEQTARWLGATTVEVMDLLWPKRSRHELILKVEPMIRARMSAQEIAKATGTDARWVCGVARSWNVSLPHSSIRLGPEIREEARRLVQSGLSRRAAARQLGISETRVSTWTRDLPCKRKGRKPNG